MPRPQLLELDDERDAILDLYAAAHRALSEWAAEFVAVMSRDPTAAEVRESPVWPFVKKKTAEAQLRRLALNETLKTMGEEEMQQPSAADQAHQQRPAAKEAGYDMLDAPVSGGVTGAEAGSLTFMCGGSPEVFARAKPILDVMGKNIFLAGGPGAGQAAKACNNMLLAINMIGISEAFNLADALGLERKTLFDIVGTASGGSWALANYCPVPELVPTTPANKDFNPGFTGAMMLNDLKLGQDAAQSLDVTSPLGAAATMLFSMYCNEGYDADDFSGIIRMLRGKKVD